MSVTSPKGFSAAAAACGIKPNGELDVALVATADGKAVPAAAVFTTNLATAAPVQVSRAHLAATAGQAAAVVLNSGNANAATGAAGRETALATCAAAADALGCASEEVLVCSTGLIGIPLASEPIVSALPKLVADRSAAGGSDAARAIMTTDTHPKEVLVRTARFSVGGMAKGAAMLAPNMATMLAFVATDAAVDLVTLQSALGRAVRKTFDRVDVDGCQSTNDSVFLLASGTAADAAEDDLLEPLAAVCSDLAEQMVRDAEGGARVARIRVTGAEDEAACEVLARSVARSALWSAALHGGDPNWGRVVAALGASDPKLELERVSVAIGDATVFHAGEPGGSLDAAADALRADEVVVSCRVGETPHAAEVLTTDLSPDYVTLNAGGMS